MIVYVYRCSLLHWPNLNASLVSHFIYTCGTYNSSIPSAMHRIWDCYVRIARYTHQIRRLVMETTPSVEHWAYLKLQNARVGHIFDRSHVCTQQPCDTSRFAYNIEDRTRVIWKICFPYLRAAPMTRCLTRCTRCQVGICKYLWSPCCANATAQILLARTPICLTSATMRMRSRVENDTVLWCTYQSFLEFKAWVRHRW